jgi:hypothetical protein
MAAHTAELHHRIPRCLFSLHERAMNGGLDGAGVEAWLEFEHEAMRYGVSVEISREDLAAIVEASTVLLAGEDHRNGHADAGDFARWGRRGGLRTLERYAHAWFAMLARRRHGLVTKAQLQHARAVLGR